MQFCRIFLGLFLVFGLRGNNGTHYAADHKSNLEKKAAKAPVSGKASLVSSSARLHPALRGQDQENLSTDLNASLQRSWSPTSVESCHGANAKSSTVEVQGLQEACKSHSGLLSTQRKFLVKLLGQELCASEWSAQQLCWRLSKRRELEMAFDFTKATFSKSEEKKETLSVSERPAPFGRQRIQRQGQQEQSQRSKRCGQRKGHSGTCLQDFGSTFATSSGKPFCSIYTQWNVDTFYLYGSSADDSSPQECVSRSQSDPCSTPTMDSQSGGIRGQGSYQELAQGNHTSWASAKDAKGDQIGYDKLREGLERSCDGSPDTFERTEGIVSTTTQSVGRYGKKSHYRVDGCAKSNCKTQQGRRQEGSDCSGRRRAQRGQRRDGYGGRDCGGLVHEGIPGAICSFSWPHSFYPTGRRARSYRAGAEKTQRWQRWASFSRGRRATSGSPAKVALSQKACWYIFCGHDEVPAQIEISHAVEAACEAKSTYHHHLFRHSVCNSKDYVSPVQALFNAQRLAHEVAQDNLVDIKGQTRFCDGVDTPLHCRLLDERNSVSVSAGAEEYTHLDGLERNGDPEDEQLVIIDGWQDLLDILHQHTPSPDFLLHLEMYGLHITHHSIRITECEATIAAIREAVQQSWRDAMPPRSVAYIHLVRPQEHRHARAVVLQLVVEIVPFGVDIPPNDVPILRRIRWHRDHSMTLETAYMRDHQTGYELLFDAHLDEWCHPRHGVQCNLHIESRIALMAHRHHLLPGSLLEIFIHDDDRPGFSVSSTDSSQHADLQPELQQPASCNPDILQEWLAECSCSHVALVMYGLFGSSLGTRYATSQADHQQVRSAVLHAWQDHVHPETSVALLMVRPQDDQHLDHLHLIVEFTSPSQARPAGYLPILQRISWHNIWQGDLGCSLPCVWTEHASTPCSLQLI